jgi:hypothetical protein
VRRVCQSDHWPCYDADLRAVSARLEDERNELPAGQQVRGRKVPDLAGPPL